MSVTLSQGKGELPVVTLSHPSGSSAQVYLHGAHVTSWRSAGREHIFVSERAVYQAKKAIRGGIPICWPQFANGGALPSHGFVRDRAWTFAGGDASASAVIARFTLTDSPDTRQLWPHAFELTYTVTLAAGTLSTRLEVLNRGDSAFAFSGALHSYFTVPRIRDAEVHGLAGCDYIDKPSGGKRVRQEEPLVIVRAETDRVYLSTPPQLSLASQGRTLLTLHKDATLPEAVVWNVWSEKVKAMADMAPHEYDAYICIEAAVVATPVTLAPGARWQGGQLLVAASHTSSL